MYISISILEHEIIKLKACKWCGSEFIKIHNRQVYCGVYCSKEAEKENRRIRDRKYYHKYKNVMNEDQRWGLGSGYLGAHMKDDLILEHKEILKEKKRLKV